MSEPVIRLDQSRPFSEIRGDRRPQDPHYMCHFQQGGLFFDAKGVLVPDDGRRNMTTIEFVNENGVLMRETFPPLYTDEMRAKVAKRLARLKGKDKAPGPEEGAAEDEDAAPEKPEVDLTAWLRGETDYPQAELYAACAARYSRKHTSIRSLVEDLVLDEKLVDESELPSHLARLLPPKPAAA